jgi:phage tail sheath protein FI
MEHSAARIQGAASDAAGLIGVSEHAAAPQLIKSFNAFQQHASKQASAFLACAMKGFFENGGRACYLSLAPQDGLQKALDALAKEKLSLLACPDLESFPSGAKFLAAHCEKLADRICILHAPEPVVAAANHPVPVHSSFAAYYHPWAEVPGGPHQQTSVPPDGHILGMLAHAGVPSGKTSAAVALKGTSGLSQAIGEPETEILNAQGVNVLRFFAGTGNLVWGGRTTSTDSGWKYVAVRRLAIYLEQSIQMGMQWAVFKPNGENLWANVRRTVADFLLETWRTGAMQGTKPEEAFFVRCDATTMTQADVNAGRLVMIAGFAPVRPAEFVILRIGQWVKPGR